MLKRRMKPLNEARLALLDQFEAEAGDKPVAAEKILEALFRPVFEMILVRAKGGRDLCGSSPACWREPRRLPQAARPGRIRRKESPLSSRSAPRSAAPLGSGAHWRLHLAHGAFLHIVAHSEVLEYLAGRCRLRPMSGAVLSLMINFAPLAWRTPERIVNANPGRRTVKSSRASHSTSAPDQPEQLSRTKESRAEKKTPFSAGVASSSVPLRRRRPPSFTSLRFSFTAFTHESTETRSSTPTSWSVAPKSQEEFRA